MPGRRDLYIQDEQSQDRWRRSRRYMKGADEDILEESYQHTRATIDDAPYPSLQVVKGGLEMLSLQYPQAKQTDASLIIEPSFMKKIDDSGFIRSLYKK